MAFGKRFWGHGAQPHISEEFSRIKAESYMNKNQDLKLLTEVFREISPIMQRFLKKTTNFGTIKNLISELLEKLIKYFTKPSEILWEPFVKSRYKFGKIVQREKGRD